MTAFSPITPAIPADPKHMARTGWKATIYRGDGSVIRSHNFGPEFTEESAYRRLVVIDSYVRHYSVNGHYRLSEVVIEPAPASSLGDRI